MVVRSDTQEGNVEKDPEGLTIHAFEADEGDHYETSERAWTDLAQALNIIASFLCKKRRNLHLYDPFFCEGASKRHLNNLGYLNVSHQNADFYKTVEDKNVPSYDILTTNPPYSKGHKERTLAFCIASKKPWMLLVPNYVCAAPYFHRVLKHRSMDDRPFFLAPHVKYEYQHRDPKHVSRIKGQTAPFYGWWFMDFPGRNQWFLERCRNVFKDKPVDVYAESEVHEKGLVPYNTRQLVDQIGFHPKGPKQAEKLQEQLIHMHQEMMAKQALFWRMQAMGSLGMHMTMNMGSVSAGNSPVSGLLNANTNMARFNSEGTGIGMNAGMAQRSAQSPMMNSNSAGQLVPSYQTSVSTQVTSSSSSNFLPTMQTRSEPSNRMAGLLFGAVNNMQVGASSASGSFQTGGSGMGMLGDLTWITRGGTNASVANNTAGSTHSLAQRSGGGSFISNSHAASSPMSAAGTSTPMQGRRVGAGDATQQSMPGTALGSPEFSSPNLTCHKCRLMGVYQCMCSGELERDLYCGKLQTQYKLQDSPLSFFGSSLKFNFPSVGANATSSGLSTGGVRGGAATAPTTQTTASPAGSVGSLGATGTSPNDLVKQMKSAAGRNAAAASLESGSSENSGLDPKPALSSTPGWLQKERNTSAKRSFEETAEEDVVDISEAYKKQRSKDWLEIKAASSSMSASFRAPQKQDRETSSSMSMSDTRNTMLSSPQSSMSAPATTTPKFGSDTDLQGPRINSGTHSQPTLEMDNNADKHVQTKEPQSSSSPKVPENISKAEKVHSSSTQILSPIVWKMPTSSPMPSPIPPGSMRMSANDGFNISHQQQRTGALQWPPNYAPGTSNAIQKQSVEVLHFDSKQSANSDSHMIESVQAQPNNIIGHRSSSIQQQPTNIWLFMPPKTVSTSSNASQPSSMRAMNNPSTSYTRPIDSPLVRNNTVGQVTIGSQNGGGVPRTNPSDQCPVVRNSMSMPSNNSYHTTNSVQLLSNTPMQQAVGSMRMLNNRHTQQQAALVQMNSSGIHQQPMQAIPLRNTSVTQQEITPMRTQNNVVMQELAGPMQTQNIGNMQQPIESKRIQMNRTLQQSYGSVQHQLGSMPTQNGISMQQSMISMPMQNVGASTPRSSSMQMQMSSAVQNPNDISQVRWSTEGFQMHSNTGPRSKIAGNEVQPTNLDTSWLLDRPIMTNVNYMSRTSIPMSAGILGAGIMRGTEGGIQVDISNSMARNGLPQQGASQQPDAMSLKWLM